MIIHRSFARGALIAATLISVTSCRPQKKDTMGAKSKIEAELVLTNGVIFTARSESEIVAGLAIAGGKIIGVGVSASLERFVGEKTRRVDLRGRFVIDGLPPGPVELGLQVWLKQGKSSFRRAPAPLSLGTFVVDAAAPLEVELAVHDR